MFLGGFWNPDGAFFLAVVAREVYEYRQVLPGAFLNTKCTI